jgi:hypothetical protein
MSTWPTAPIEVSQMDGPTDVPPREAFLALTQAVNQMIDFGSGTGLVRVSQVTAADLTVVQTFTRHERAKWVLVELVGSGGRGTVPQGIAANNTFAFGCPGGGGGYCLALFEGNFTSATLTVGAYAAQPPGWVPTNSGNTLKGGDTTFVVTPSTRFARAGGGLGGSATGGQNPAAVPYVSYLFGSGGDAGAALLGGDRLLEAAYGSSGGQCVAMSGIQMIGAPGLPRGAVPVGNEWLAPGGSNPGLSSDAYGAGGRGHYVGPGQTRTAEAGLMSRGGMARIWEFG